MCQKSLSSPLCNTPKKGDADKQSRLHSSFTNLKQLLEDSYDDFNPRCERGFGNNSFYQMTMVILKNIWLSLGLIMSILEISVTYERKHSQELPLSYLDKMIHHGFIFFLIGETIRHAWLKAITYTDKKEFKESRKNSTITVRTKKVLKGRKNMYAFVPFIIFLFLQAIFLPLFQLEGNSELTHLDISGLFSSMQRNFHASHGPKYTHSFIEVCFVLFTSKIRDIMALYFRARKKALALWVSKRTAAQVLKNPLRLHFRLQQLFTVLRLVKYLPQLIGTCNKLNGHVQDFIKKYKERRRKQKAELAWSRLMESVYQKQKLDRAVRRIQENFRKRRERKSIRIISHINSRPRKAAEVFRRIEKKMSQRAEESRKRLDLAEKSNQELSKRRKVTHSDKKQIEKHEKEMRDTHRQLLLSPNTSFSVSWKMIAISCVFFELFVIAISPYLSGKMKKMPLYQLIEIAIPIPTDCRSTKKDSSISLIPMLSVFNADLSKSSPAIISSSVQCSTFLETRSSMILMLSSNLELLLYVVSFLDVFVTFFTGEIQHNCGLVVRPKSFFVRWLIPGVGLQLIVNPSMRHVGTLLKRVLSFCFAIGPIKSIQILSVIWPYMMITYKFCIDAMYDFIERQNARVMKRKV